MSGGRRRLGKYELVAQIGEGGMADVHLARQLGARGFQKLVVVKTVKPALATRADIANMLLDEARLAALVKHNNVVDIYDLGEVDGTFFIAMEYLEGESLAAVLVASRGGVRLDPFSTTRIICDSAAGLHAAHELRDMSGEALELVHQDVTPGNVIVLYSGQVKLVDFGVAKVRTTGHDGMVKGKTGYLAPELLAGAEPDRRSDVWSLGVVLWESLTLRRLFAGKSEGEQLNRIKNGEIPAPSRLHPAVPRELDEVCLQALVRNPDKRYQTAATMQRDLEMILRHASWSTHEPIARFMRQTFASRITARQDLLKELATAKGPRAQTLDQIIAIVDDEASAVPQTNEDVVGSHGVGTRQSGRTPAGVISPPPARSNRKRNAVIALVIGGAAIAGGAIAANYTGKEAEPTAAVVPIDAAVVARVDPPEVAPVREVTPDAAVALPDAAVEVAVETDDDDDDDDDDKKRRKKRDKEKEAGEGSGSGSTAPPVVVAPPTPTSAKSLYKEGLQKFVGGDASGAIVLFEQARKKDSGYAPAYRGLGMAYEKLGKNSKAKSAFATYLKLAPTASDAATIRARMEAL